MSDNVLKLIPQVREFLPSREAAEEARTLLEEFFPEGEQAEVDFSDVLKFRDGGANLERIACPDCHKTTEINPFRQNDAGTAWWYEFDDALSAVADLTTLRVKMPCCSAVVSVLDIDFAGAAGYSRFELCIWNPDTDAISTEQVAALEELVGCKLSQVWAHY